MQFREGKVYHQCGACHKDAVRSFRIGGRKWGEGIRCSACGRYQHFLDGHLPSGVFEAARNLMYVSL